MSSRPTTVTELRKIFVSDENPSENSLEQGNLVFDPDVTTEVQGKEVNTALKIFEVIAKSLDSILVVESSNLKTPYEIVLGEVKQKQVYEGRVATKKKLTREGYKYYEIDEINSIKVNKPVQPLILKINPKLFSFRDIPALVKELAETHNKWIDDLEEGTPEQKDLWRMNVGIEFAKKFIAVAEILRQTQKPETDGQEDKVSILTTHAQTIQEIATLLEEIAQSYGADLEEIKGKITQIDPLVKSKIEQILTKPRPTSGTKIGSEEVVAERRLRAILKLVEKGIAETERHSLESSFFDRAAAEVLRLTGMDQLLEDFEREVKTDKTIQVLKTDLDTELTELQALQKRLQQLQQSQGQESKSEEISEIQQKIENQKQLISEIQTNIAYLINNFIYGHQDKYFPYRSSFYQPSQIAEQRYINCMARAFLQYTILKKYFGLKVLGATTTRHFFAILPLANGTYLSLDFRPTILTKDGQPLTELQPHNTETNYTLSGKPIYFNQGNFEKMFVLAVLNCEHQKYPPLLAEQMFKIALDIDPNDVAILNNLATLYRENVATFTDKFGSEKAVLSKAEELYKKAIKILEKQPSPLLYWVKLGLADVYRKRSPTPENLQQALNLYQEVVNYLKENPNIQLWMSTEEIKKLIAKLTKKLESDNKNNRILEILTNILNRIKIKTRKILKILSFGN